MELSCSKGFGEQVGNVTVGRDVMHLYLSIFNGLAQIRNPSRDVLEATRGRVVFREEHGRNVVAEEDRWFF